MKSCKQTRWFVLVLMLLGFMLCFSPAMHSLASVPDELHLFTGQSKSLDIATPVSATVANPAIARIAGSIPHSLQSGQIGHTDLKLSLFGAIPLKTVKINVIPHLKVVPGGQTIGVKLKSAGVLVVGHHLVTVAPNKKISPGEEAKIELGDLIVKIDGVQVKEVKQVADKVQKAGESQRPLVLTILRHGKNVKIELRPVQDHISGAYRLGLYIRDSAAGVGTLTFYAPEQGVYGALGHVITDMDTQTPIVVGDGEIVHSSVTSIAKGHQGEPGEKRAHFFKESKILGNIEKNSSFGIFGKMYGFPDNSFSKEAIPVGFSDEVKIGPAQIYTVIEGQKVEKFNIEVVHIARQDVPATKGLVIKVTDPQLLERTGGIIQGMSGSPIIQNGKLIGAVTHVFVNDPTSGYGCFIEWMLQDSGILAKTEKLEAS